MTHVMRQPHTTDAGTVDARGLGYRQLNERIHLMLARGATHLRIQHVCGQYYLADGLKGDAVELTLEGIPGNDLAAFMDGPRVVVRGNVQDAAANTMNSGEVVIHGHAGDILGHSMRGGRVFVRHDVGYRVGIHMKAYRNSFPVIVVGGTARDFLGEYMAGGLIVILGLSADTATAAPGPLVGDFVGTGMHGGTILLRGTVDPRTLGKEVKTAAASGDDLKLVHPHLEAFCRYFALDVGEILEHPFTKLFPHTHRPYGKIYAY